MDEHPLLGERAVEAHRSALDRQIESSERRSTPQNSMQRVGRYSIVRELGRGGMSVVYECEQDSPKRRVAVKLLHTVLASSTLRQRLRLEAEILGRLQHDGIAQVYEAGVCDTPMGSRPYFAMELVAGGLPATHFADRASLGRRERLEMLAKIAEAIGHAHAKGVVHRDLKPENVLVTPEGKPKVLDFGIAHVADETTLAATTITREGQILGTLAYMAPEQLGGTCSDITARADVYALGVMGFELLSGQLPIELAGMSLSAAFRMIEIREPPRLRAVQPALKGEAETIIERCLNRDPNRRYANGTELAADIRRHLSNQPILARPTTRLYRARKYAARNRTLVIGTLATILTLIAGISAATILAAGQYQARLAAEESDREARRQQALLVARTFQGAADEAIGGRVLPAIESLESVPAGLRGWGWDLLAASVPAWMPGEGDFGGMAFNRDAGTAWTGNRLFAVVKDTSLVLTVIDGTLVTWNPLTGDTASRPELGRFSRVEQVGHEPLPNVIAYGPNGEMFLLNTSDWSIARAPPSNRPSASASRYESASGAWLWLEEAGGNGPSQGDGLPAFIATPSHGPKALNLGPDADTDLPGWVDVRNIDERAVVSLYRESEPPHWFRFAVIDTATGMIAAKSERVEGSMSFVLLAGREEIAAAQMTYPDREPTGSIVVFDAATLEIKRRFNGVAQPLAYLPDRDRLVVRLEDGPYRLMDPDTGQLDNALLLDHGSPFPTVAPNGETLARNYPLIAANGVMHGGASIVAITPRPYRPIVIDTTDPQIGLRPTYHARPLPGALYHLAISPGGGLLAAMSPWQDEVALMDARTGETLAMLPMRSSQGHRWHAMLWFSPDGDELLATVHAQDKEVVGVTRWDLADGTSQWSASDDPVPHNFTVPRLDHRTLPAGNLISSRHAVTPAGDALLFTGSGENTIKQLNLDSQTIEALPIGTAEGIAFSPDGRHLAAVATLGARIIDFETGDLIARPISDPDRMLCAAYSPDGSTLAVGSYDGRIFVIETEFYTLLYSFQSTPPEDGRGPLFVHDLRWSPDSQTLYAAHAGGVLTAWDARPPWERRDQRDLWLVADEAVAPENASALPDPHRPGLSDTELAAVEVARVKRWSVHKEELEAQSPSTSP